MHYRDSCTKRRAERRRYAGGNERRDARAESGDAACAGAEREPLGDGLLILEVDEQEADAPVYGLDRIARQVAHGDREVDGRASASRVLEERRRERVVDDAGRHESKAVETPVAR